MDKICNAYRPFAFRRGATAIELIVAATLLVTAIGTMAPLAVSAGRLRRDARHHQLALDELSNQLDRLSGLDAQQREAELEELAPSEETRAVLAEATLEGEVVRDKDGTRLVLALQWKRSAGAAPLRLVGWLDALPADAADNPLEQSEEKTR